MNNLNNLGSAWRTLPPQSPTETSFLSNGSGGAFQRPGARQITKTPQNMFQNFPPTTQNSMTNFGNFGSFGNNGMGGGSSGGGGLLSPGGGLSSGRMSSGNSYDFNAGLREQQQQQQPSFGRSNGMNPAGTIGSFAGSSSSSSSSRMMSSNGYEGRAMGSNGFNSSVNGSGFERSVSGNLFEPLGSSSNGFSRQMSMPSNLCDQVPISQNFILALIFSISPPIINRYKFILA
jgi:hypothetical protein